MTDSRRILVNPRQRGNPILSCMTNVPYEFNDEILSDYQVGKSTGVFFLSLRYHALKPEYIHDRLKQAGKFSVCAVLLLLVDSKDLDNLFNEINRLCVMASLSLIMAFSNEEAAQYLELFKLNENKPPDALMGKRPTDQLSAAVDFLTSIKPVNKSDALALIKTFKTLNNILTADKKALSIVPGLGQRKVEALVKALHSDATNKGKQTVLSQYFGGIGGGVKQSQQQSSVESVSNIDESTTGSSSNVVSDSDLLAFIADDDDFGNDESL